MKPEEPDSSAAPEDERQALDELAERFFEERRAGGTATVEDFAARHPELAEEIRRVFPALVRLERAGGSVLRDSAAVPPIERLGEYRIVREIGRGGMGVVYEAKQEALDRHVALKVLPPQATLDGRYLERFRREAHAAASLQHPNIVSVFGVGEEQGVHFFAMQYVEGKSLDRVLGEIRRWRREEDSAPEHVSSAAASALTSGEGGHERYSQNVARIGLRLAEALAHAHARGVLHRDVKPSNVLLDGNGKPWIADFGLAKTEESGDLTFSGDIVGTLRYLAPERFAGAADARADVYGLGMTLYELLTLQPAFDETDRAQLVRKVAQELPPRPRRVDRRIPQDLESIVLKAIEKLPELRYASADALATDLRAFLERRPVSARPPSATHLLRLAVRRNKPLAATVCLALVVLLTASVVYVANLKRARDATQATLEQMRAQALVSASVEAASSDAMLALLLAREAVEIEEAPETLSQLQRAAANARERAVFTESGEFVDVVVSPRGDAILTSSSNRVFLLDLDGNEKLRLRMPAVISVGFSPDGERLVASSRRGVVRTWDLEGRVLASLEHERAVRSACVSPDGRYLLTASLDRTARLWHSDGRVVETLEHPAEVLFASFSGDGRHFVTACVDGKGRLWGFDPDSETVRLVAELGGHEGQVSTAYFSAKGDRIVTNSCVSVWLDPSHGDETARLWDLSGRLIAVLGNETRHLQWAGFFPDGERVLGLFTNGKARIWDAADGRLSPHQGHIPTGSPAWFPGFSADGSRFAVGCVDGSAWLFDDTAKVVASLTGHETDVFATRITPDGSIVTASGDRTVRIWDATVLPEFHGHGAAVYQAAYSPDGDKVVTPSEDWTARVWSSEGGPLAVLEGHGSYVTSAVFSPDGERVLTTSRDATARLWDLDGNELRVYRHDADTRAASFSPVRDEIATVCRGGAVTLWTLAGQRLEAFEVEGWPRSVAYSADGETLLIGARRVAVLCSRSGAVLRTFAGHAHDVTSAVFSPEGDLVLTASADTTARLWDARTGEELRVFSGHQGSLHQAAFAPDGTSVVTASEDDTIRIWDLDGEPVSVLRGQQGLHSAVFSPDGRGILSSSWTGSARIWMTDMDEVLGLAERRASRDFTASELLLYEDLLDVPAREAVDLVDGLAAELVLAERVVARLRADDDLDPLLRETAVRVAAAVRPTASELNNGAWELVARPGRSAEELADAVRMAEQANRQSPDTPNLLNTLGVAQLRAGLLDAALETLTHSDGLNRSSSSPYNRASDLLPLAMVLEGLGRRNEAADALAEADSLLLEEQDPQVVEELQGFHEEAVARIDRD